MGYLRRLSLLAVAALVLTSCGFRPLYLSETGGLGAGGQSVFSEMELIEVLPITDRRGQILRNELVDRLNPQGTPDVPQYFLDTNLREQIRELASRIDDSSTRANLILTANFSLTARGERLPLLTGRVQSTNNYSISQSDIATLAAERDARERGARDIAERMLLQIGAFMSSDQVGPAAAR